MAWKISSIFKITKRKNILDNYRRKNNKLLHSIPKPFNKKGI